jgi:hypothetical protein
MECYKFLHTRDLDRVLIEGTVKIASLSHYRQLEERQWIADRLEGTVEVKMTEGLLVTGNEISSFTPSGYPLSVVASGGGRILIGSGVTLRYVHPEAFLFCASHGDLISLTKAMCEEPMDDPYDACVRINDLQFLAHRLFYRGRIKEMSNTKIKDLFTHFAVSTIEYRNLSLDQKSMVAPPAPPSPFIKHNNPFPRQREVRIAFVGPRQPLPSKTLIVNIPHPGEMFVELFRGAPTRATPDPVAVPGAVDPPLSVAPA